MCWIDDENDDENENFKLDCNGLRFVYIVDEMFGDLNYKFWVVCVVIDGDRMSKRCAPLWVFLVVLEKFVLE